MPASFNNDYFGDVLRRRQGDQAAVARLERRHRARPRALSPSGRAESERVDRREGDRADELAALHGDTPASGLRNLDVRGELVPGRCALPDPSNAGPLKLFSGDRERCGRARTPRGPKHFGIDRTRLHGGEDSRTQEVKSRPGRAAVQEPDARGTSRPAWLQATGSTATRGRRWRHASNGRDSQDTTPGLCRPLPTCSWRRRAGATQPPAQPRRGICARWQPFRPSDPKYRRELEIARRPADT